ncbi:hypothetical protein [Amycolatopsis sp. GM8]|uniref:hypothetical protein n=1 Tax=Amycolatopsis sp. GM8 TaxID=2896530 RepID=UPI001F320238|nr:hypothetical protein [Amycolatopsis sp. GM8]
MSCGGHPRGIGQLVLRALFRLFSHGLRVSTLLSACGSLLLANGALQVQLCLLDLPLSFALAADAPHRVRSGGTAGEGLLAVTYLIVVGQGTVLSGMLPCGR